MFSPTISLKLIALLLSSLNKASTFIITPQQAMQNVKNECSPFIRDKYKYASLKPFLGMQEAKEQGAESIEPLKKSQRKAKEGDIVTIDYILDSGDFVTEPLFDTRGKVTFVMKWGNYLPGVHELILGMTEGTSVTNVNIDAGWGDRQEQLIFKVPKSSIEGSLDFESLKVGTELYLQSNKVVVSKVEEDYIEIDANPPLAGASYSCSLKLLEIADSPKTLEYVSSVPIIEEKFSVATFALGCFWGSELAYMREPGVVGTKVGYTQGSDTDPTPNYEMVCSGETAFTEAMLVIYDPNIVSYERLVKLSIERLGDSVYLLNQVGNDVGTQYRSGIYYHNDHQYEVAKKLLAALGEKCVTELLPAKTFYDAEDYHQQYLLKNGQSAKKNALEDIRCYG